MEGIHAATIVKIQLPIVGPIRDASIDVSLPSCLCARQSLIASTLQLNTVAEYFTTKRPTTRRVIRRAVSYPVALPLAVNVQDFFREDW
jgi:trafficking protein particle complex subunit 10